MKKPIVLAICAFIVVFNAYSATYTLCTSGNWDNTSATAKFSSDGGSTCTIFADDLPALLADGDVIEIPSGFTVTFIGVIDIDDLVTFDVDGTLDFDNGKLHLTDDGSTIVLQVGSHITCSGTCASNDQIKIGQTPMYQYKGSDLDDLENGPRPAVMDNTGSILPVTLKAFSGESKKGVVVLSWVTTMEENFAEFVIEHSTDGYNYSAIGTLQGQARNLYDVESKYSFTDDNPFIGRNYYRLVAVDIDNSKEIFGPVLVAVKTEKFVSVYPNPTKGDQLFFKSNFTPSETDRIVLVNQLGIEILNIPAQAPRLTHVFAKDLEAGVYFLRYVGQEFNSTTRVIVNNK